MLFGPDERPGVLSGETALVHRRWRTPRVYAGRTYRTNIGRIVIAFHLAEDPDLREGLARRADPDPGELADLHARLDAASPRGAWTRVTLEIIAARPATRAGDLAGSLGRETAPFKLDVRKLKNLGLTRSLEVGYRLAPRGAAYLRWLS